MLDIWSCKRERWGHGPSRKHRKSGKVLSAVGSTESHETLSEDNMSRPVHGHQLKETKKREVIKFKSLVTNSQTDVKQSFHARKASQVTWSIKLRFPDTASYLGNRMRQAPVAYTNPHLRFQKKYIVVRTTLRTLWFQSRQSLGTWSCHLAERDVVGNLWKVVMHALWQLTKHQ